MPVNATYEYDLAKRKYEEARDNNAKMLALREMLSTAPSHKGAEKLRSDIKQRISRLKESMVKEKKQQKTSGSTSYNVKKEGAAQVAIVGATNSGKSTLLKRLTNANVEIAEYPFTTKKPELGIMDHKGIKIQIVEIPAVVRNFTETLHGPALLSIIRNSDLVILMFKTSEEKALLDNELSEIDTPVLIFNDQENIQDEIWRRLPVIKVYTKQPGKERDHPPIAFKKGSTVRDVAEKVHKEFIKKFRYAKIFGKSVKFNGAQVGLDHALADDDVVEFHLK